MLITIGSGNLTIKWALKVQNTVKMVLPLKVSVINGIINRHGLG